MNKTIYIIVIAFFTILQTTAQDFTKKWKEIYELELEGKTKTAFEKVTEIHKTAWKQKNDIQQIKSFIYLSKFKNTLVENSETNFFTEIENEINKSSEIGKAFLCQYYATNLSEYLDKNLYKIKEDYVMLNTSSTNIKLWDRKKFLNKIETNFEKSVANILLLKAKKVADYQELITDTDPNYQNKDKSLYTFLMENYIFQTKSLNALGYYSGLDFKEHYFSPSYLFIKINTDSIENKRDQKIVKILQSLEQHNIDNEPIVFFRIKYMIEKSNKNLALIPHLEKCKSLFENLNYKQEIDFVIAEIYNQFADKKTTKDYKLKALSILDNLLLDKKNPPIYTEAFNLKEEILSKELSVRIKKNCYPKENIRAFVEFKNIDTLSVSYYKISVDELQKFKTDTIVLKYMDAHQTIQSYIRTLPKITGYLENSTEILLDSFESGYYLVVLGTPKKNGNYSFTYQTITCTSIDYFKEKKDRKEIFHFRNKKTGVPIQNVAINFDNKVYISGKDGKITIEQPLYVKEKNNIYQIKIIHQKDTLIAYLGTKTSEKKEEKEEEIFTSKVYLYFDRAIYRPGQKMFYKGIITQEKNFKTSVVPFVTVKITVNNPEYDEVAAFEIQTNEFGSFNGEFTLPNNGSTGRYYMEVEEPDSYEKDTKYFNKEEEEHSFWDEVDFDSDTFDFQVEEYKRPTFEVKMNPIPEEWKLCDTIILKGKAIGLAGNTISNAAVIATVTFTKKEDSDFDRYELDEIKTITNTDGSFEINIPTDTIKIITKNYKLDFEVKIEVVDLNGETRTTDKEITITDEQFYLQLNSDYNFLLEAKNTISISAKTYNEVNKNVVGKINIYKTNRSENLFSRQYGIPDVETIDSIQFAKLFPYEKYHDKASKVLIKTLDFDTKISNILTLDLLEIGNYYLEAIAFDDNKNEIKSYKTLRVNSKLPFVSNNKMFSYFEDNKENSDNVIITLKSKISNLVITCFEYNEQDYVTKEHIIQLENGEAILKFKKPNNRLGFYFFAYFESHFYSENHTLYFNNRDKQLQFEILSMRNKIEPGSTENWQFKVLNSKLESEILASMYDTALDDFATLYWDRFEKQRNNIDFPIYENYDDYEAQFHFTNFDKKTILFYFQEQQYLNWFGLQENKNYLQTLREKDKNEIISGKLIVSDEIPKLYYIYNTSNYESSKSNLFGNFRINGKVNDIIEINDSDNKYVYKINEKNILINFNDTHQNNLTLISKRNPFKSKPVTINNKKVIFESKQKFTEILNSTIYTSKGIKLTNYEKFMYDNFYNKDGKHKIEYDSLGNGKLTDKNFEDLIASNFGQIKEIVIEGALGIKRTRDAVVSASRQISTYEITQSASPNAIQALTGKVSGLQITENANGVYGNTKIVLRGNRSITGNNQALVVIDGVISSANVLTQLPADVIESINVLKGAEGAALYGEQGVNGVLIITTIKGIQELTNVKTRKNFNETAFFFPNIKTDDSGKFILEFTVPESLTRWKLNLLAHNKNGDSGVFSKEIISQKDLMLIPNMPRFVRENDELIVTAKVSNLLNEAKTGIAKLSLFDAGTGNPIDALVETKEIQNFNCKAKGSTTVQWKIKIPKDIQGLQYKIVAKAGNFTDGEENILPVLKNAVLITESQPVWLKAKDTKTITFEALTNTSNTKENHKISINLVTNPIWSVIEALPYLMEYEHDCAEQTFSKLFANSISEKIINQNPKIKTVLENWKQNPTSKLKMNEDLKSVLLSETPWLVENNDELQKRVSALLDISKLKTTNEVLFHKLKEKHSTNGGFSWFGVGNENEYITRHILSGIGHLNKLNPESFSKYEDIVKKGISYLDSKFETSKTNRFATSNLHHLYTRSFFLKEHSLSKKQDSIVKLQLVDYKKNWLQKSLYEKTVLALVLHRFDDKSFAKKIIEHLRESTVLDETKGMFWKENTNGYYWHQSKIELQALLIEAFAEIDYKTNEIEAMKVWLLNNKQNKNWNTTKSTALAINAIISYGKDWLNSESKIQINDGKNAAIQQQLNSKLKETANGLINLEIGKSEITKNLTEIKLENNGIAPVYGGVYYQYFENLDKISATTSSEYMITKDLLKEDKLVNAENLKVGDLITIRLTFKTEKDLEFVHVKDLRASCFEPVNVISETKWINNTHYYMSTKDVASHFFFDNLPKGTYVLEYKVRINNEGTFSDGYANFQSMYAPEFSAHSKSGMIKTHK